MRLLIAISLVLTASGCALFSAEGELAGAGSTVPNRGAPATTAETPRPDVASLGASDIFEVRVYDEPELTGIFRVGSDGTVDYPLCGRLEVEGLKAFEVADVVSACLKDGFLRSPQVSVLFKENNSKKIFVFGEVQKPGTFAFDDGMSVVEAVTRAGGFTRLAAKNQVVISRVVDGKEQRLRMPVEDIGAGSAPNFFLQPGDIIWVPESFF